MVSATINDNDFGSDNVEAEWDNEFEYNTGEEDEEGEPILEETEVNPYTNVNEQRTYLVQRVRRSFSANLDYQINPNNNIYLKTMYNWRDDRENRFRLEQEILDGEDIEVGDFTLNNGTLTRFPVESSRHNRISWVAVVVIDDVFGLILGIAFVQTLFRCLGISSHPIHF